MRVAPMARGVRSPLAMPTAKTRKNVPTNSTRYFFIEQSVCIDSRAACANPVEPERPRSTMRRSSSLLATLLQFRSRLTALRASTPTHTFHGEVRRISSEDHLFDALRLEENRAQGNPPRYLTVVLLRREDRRPRIQRFGQVLAHAHP